MATGAIYYGMLDIPIAPAGRVHFAGLEIPGTVVGRTHYASFSAPAGSLAVGQVSFASLKIPTSPDAPDPSGVKQLASNEAWWNCAVSQRTSNEEWV